MWRRRRVPLRGPLPAREAEVVDGAGRVRRGQEGRLSGQRPGRRRVGHEVRRDELGVVAVPA